MAHYTRLNAALIVRKLQLVTIVKLLPVIIIKSLISFCTVQVDLDGAYTIEESWGVLPGNYQVRHIPPYPEDECFHTQN